MNIINTVKVMGLSAGPDYMNMNMNVNKYEYEYNYKLL